MPFRVLFAGGKDVGCGCLDALIGHPDVEVVGVLANPGADTVGSRWYRSAVEIALEHEIPVFSPARIKDPAWVSRIRSWAPDLWFCVYYDQILSPALLAIPARGCINLHLAIAEEYRGCFPTTWAVLNGESETGVTLHFMDAGIDSGDVIAQQRVPIGADDTGKDVYDRCTQAGIQLFRSSLAGILDGSHARRPQVATSRTKYYPREFPRRDLDFTQSGADVLRQIRALSFPPFEPPGFWLGGRRMVVVEARNAE